MSEHVNEPMTEPVQPGALALPAYVSEQRPGMSWGLTACVLIRLDARLGEQVSVDDLAAHLAVHPGVVREELSVLASQGQLSVTRGEDGVITHATVDPLKHKGLVR